MNPFRDRTDAGRLLAEKLAAYADRPPPTCETRAVEPLERNAAWDTGEVPDTFPFAV